MSHAEDPDHGAVATHNPATAPRPVRAGKFLILLGVAAVAIAVFDIRGRSHEESKLTQWTEDRAVPTVEIAKVQQSAETRELALPGDVEAFYNASLHGQVSGYVRVWNYDIGATVKKGDILAVIDTPEVDQQLTMMQGELLRAKANLALADVTADRWNSLRGSAAVSQQASDEKAADASAKKADVEAAQANLDRVKALKSFAQIVAPFDGVVTARNIDIGSLVNSGANAVPLFNVADIHQMRIYVPVPESYADEIKAGMKATLSLPELPDRVFDATVATTSHAIDKKSRSLLVELLADNPDGALSPGAFARVHFQIPGDTKSVVLPASAVVFRGSSTEIATIGPDNRVAFEPIRIKRDLGSAVEIIGNLPDGQRVVSNPPDSLVAGDEVKLVGETTKTAGATTGESSEKVAETARSRSE